MNECIMFFIVGVFFFVVVGRQGGGDTENVYSNISHGVMVGFRRRG